MASADELKALGNKAMSDKNFDDAMYVCPRQHSRKCPRLHN